MPRDQIHPGTHPDNSILASGDQNSIVRRGCDGSDGPGGCRKVCQQRAVIAVPDQHGPVASYRHHLPASKDAASEEHQVRRQSVEARERSVGGVRDVRGIQFNTYIKFFAVMRLKGI